LTVLDDAVAAAAEEPYADGRAADLARTIRVRPDAADALLAGYEVESTPLDEGERAALLLRVGALALDDLADTLASWASRGSENPPLEAIDELIRRLTAYFEQIGVPFETGPPWRRRRS
jgi:hypothetical protein